MNELTSNAADKNYGWMQSREKFHEEGMRRLIRYRLFCPIDHAHNARVDRARYRQRAMFEMVFWTVKRTLGDVVRALTWYGEFPELVLMCGVHNFKQVASQ